MLRRIHTTIGSFEVAKQWQPAESQSLDEPRAGASREFPAAVTFQHTGANFKGLSSADRHMYELGHFPRGTLLAAGVTIEQPASEHVWTGSLSYSKRHGVGGSETTMGVRSFFQSLTTLRTRTTARNPTLLHSPTGPSPLFIVRYMVCTLQALRRTWGSEGTVPVAFRCRRHFGRDPSSIIVGSGQRTAGGRSYVCAIRNALAVGSQTFPLPLRQ
jgi:hypothetical protein